MGCMEGITYNGENITNLVRRKKVDTSSFVRTAATLRFSWPLGTEGLEEDQRHKEREETGQLKFVNRLDLKKTISFDVKLIFLVRNK